MKAFVLLIGERDRGRLGHRRELDASLGGSTVVAHAARRAAAVAGVSGVRLVHPAGEPVPGGLDGVGAFAFDPALDPPAAQTARRTARAWSPWAWRGGLGGSTVFDELLPAAPLLAAAEDAGAEAVVLAGADWPLLDADLAGRMLALHAAEPEALPLVFSQAPPGLAPVVLGVGLLAQLAAEERAAAAGGFARGHPTRRGFAGLLAYQPARARVDPLASDANAAVPAAVRDAARRFVSDTPAGTARVRRLARRLGDRFADADADAVVAATLSDEADGGRFATLPPLLHVELTPRRWSRGSATPPAPAPPRGPMPPALLEKIARQSAGLAVTLGGLGDAGCHPDAAAAVAAFRGAGAAGVAVETSLQGACDAADRGAAEAVAAAVRGWAVDVVLVRLNAASAAVYAEANGADGFDDAVAALHGLLPDPSVPRIVPVLTKTRGNVADLEPFFERWWQLADHAILERFPTGGTGRSALTPDASPVPMDPPWTPPRPTQAKRRLTVLADGTVCLCHQDWHGRLPLGDAGDAPLAELWAGAATLALDPAWTPDDSPLCRRCFDFLTLARGAA
ncbi:SPASM domain-containing protein [Phycisphaera mikurensis]|uniref:4Fe4S-binding SPASM domain-containing protein n=1 Tax=Phycisphaera mikurensis (strain NBRC 102666 / KCTC 22515 / FYK2301M01) TaxID=1142394 RepID=I0IB86_PHYMF|nr:SPASM domain-containing protein [Phycisphaera mikurensis]MBB6443022.1 hypothetical protein [Phycisphaera mikurensis]BAM02524.1 hypothetical protein PSMK_03650 [Phycisphaera mikurensis NBRC 102666]